MAKLTQDDVDGIDRLKFPCVIAGTRYEHKDDGGGQQSFMFTVNGVKVKLIVQVRSSFDTPKFWVKLDGKSYRDPQMYSIGDIAEPKLRKIIAKAFSDLRAEERRLDPTKRHARAVQTIADHEAARRSTQKTIDKL